MGAAKTTIDHREIQRWVEQHGGQPATVRRTRSKGNPGMIRIDFPGFSGEDSLEPIGWDEWFEQFDQQKLAFLYQQGKDTNFNKLVRRDPDEVRPSDRRRGPSRTTRGGRAAARALAAEARNDGQSSGSSERSRPDGARASSARSSSRRTKSARSSSTRSNGARTSGSRSGGERTSGARSGSERTSSARSGSERTSGARSNGARTGSTRSSGARASSSASSSGRSNRVRGRSSSAGTDGARSSGSRSDGRRPEEMASSSKAELYQRARDAGIERSSSMNKSELIQALGRVRGRAR